MPTIESGQIEIAHLEETQLVVGYSSYLDRKSSRDQIIEKPPTHFIVFNDSFKEGPCYLLLGSDMKEYFWVVDTEDRVIGKETREKCHRDELIHRSVYIFLFNFKNELFLQKRSELKDLYPGFYTGSATGHVDFGETYDQAAQRELKEELGINVPLKRVCKFKSFSAVEKEISILYVCHYDGKIQLDKKEISQGLFLTLPQVREEMETGRKQFAQGFKIAFREYLKSRGQET